MVSKLIEAKTQTVAPLLRQAAALAYHRRGWGMLSTVLQRTVATSLLGHPGMGNMPGPGPEPPLGDLLQIAMEIPKVSRLPLRDDQEEAGACCHHPETSNANGMMMRVDENEDVGSLITTRPR